MTSITGALVLYTEQHAFFRPFLAPPEFLKPPVDVDESSDDEDFDNFEFEDDLPFLRSLDPKEWKDQDHYAVLGLKGIRHKATEDLIKRACKWLYQFFSQIQVENRMS